MAESWRRAVLAALSVGYLAAVAAAWPYTMDDAYISLRYASHLAQGLGLTWNPGGEPVEGYSNFLWVLWMSVATGLPGDPMVWTKLLGAGFGLATVLVLAREGRDVVSEGPLGLLPAGFLALSPMFAFWSSSGIEMPAYALALLLGWRGLRCRRPLLAGPALVAASLLRPEGLLIGAVAGAAFLFPAAWRRDRRALRSLGATAACVAFCLAPYLVWRMRRYGDFLANTVHAKWQPQGGIRYFVMDFGYYQGVHLLLALFGLATSSSGASEASRDPGASPLVWAGREEAPSADARWACAAMIAAQAALLANTRPGMGFYLRLFWPVTSFLYLLSASAIRPLARGLRRSWLVAAPVGVLLAWPVLRDLSPVRLPGSQVAAPVRKTALAVSEILQTVHTPLAEWIERNHPGSTVALTDCGLLPYVSDARIVDLWGLNDPEISRRGFDADRVLARRPDLLVLASRSAEHFEARFPMDGQLQSHPLVARDYTLVKIFTWRNDVDGSGDYSLWVYAREDPARIGASGSQVRGSSR